MQVLASGEEDHTPPQPAFFEKIADITGFKPQYFDQDRKNFAASHQDGRLYQVRIVCPYVSMLMSYDTVKRDWSFHPGPPCDIRDCYNTIYMGHVPQELSAELQGFPTVIFQDKHPNEKHGPFKDTKEWARRRLTDSWNRDEDTSEENDEDEDTSEGDDEDYLQYI